MQRTIAFGNPCGYSPAPVFLGPPDTPSLACSPVHPACNIVEGPIAMNANSPCGLHVSCGLPAQANFVMRNPGITDSGNICNKGAVKSSTSVTPVNINNAPEPPQRQRFLGPAVPAKGQVPGRTIASASADVTNGVLWIGVGLIALYFITR